MNGERDPVSASMSLYTNLRGLPSKEDEKWISNDQNV